MTIYNISVVTSTGYPYYHKDLKNLKDLHKGIKLSQRFFDFTERIKKSPAFSDDTRFELNAGLISALFGFAKNINKKIKTLEFKSSKGDDNYFDNEEKYKGNVLITTQTETYLLHKAIKEKIKLIYHTIISPKIPLESAEKINKNEEQKIVDILTDEIARSHVLRNQSEIRALATKFLEEMRKYGLNNIVITSFDLSPIKVFGKYSFMDIEIILRNIGEIPGIAPLEWKYRQGFYFENQVWVYIINSGIGVKVESLFEPYFYLLFANAQSYLGEFPLKLATSFNLVLG